MIAGFERVTLLPLLGVASFLAALWLYLPTAFIRRHSGSMPSNIWSITGVFAYLIFIMFWFLGPYSVRDIDSSTVMLVCGFCLMFFLLDISNKWLPIEFTFPFCLLGLAIHFSNGSGLASLKAFMGMWVFLCLLRSALGWLYRTESLGKGDVWLVSGIAAWSGFIYAAVVMAFGIMFTLIWVAMRALIMKRRAESVPSGVNTLPLAPAICTAFIISTLFNVPLITNLAF